MWVHKVSGQIILLKLKDTSLTMTMQVGSGVFHDNISCSYLLVNGWQEISRRTKTHRYAILLC